jgi:hypothetical protein
MRGVSTTTNKLALWLAFVALSAFSMCRNGNRTYDEP